ncbi:uncharacterized protein BDZ99DRAFT_466527 [Mytilinidion resinicola]|uniref:Uncharacterized protein n=1 Tax=Mytilinidion resinicola TaxID=574789 RepID=A0A6A6YCJ3_9PEZI|nr:uncharacterized protein BDZ99DRAFT_466527 [Mytilinidion resinicola]KAF2805557.1 hypothetical protein BDZ99DRAFT_466527 [Mytilinidion resinicola]
MLRLAAPAPQLENSLVDSHHGAHHIPEPRDEEVDCAWGAVDGCREARLPARLALSAHLNSFPSIAHGNTNRLTLFSVGTNALTAGIASCPSPSGFMACHKHTQSEAYCIISAYDFVSIKGERHVVRPGSTAFVQYYVISLGTQIYHCWAPILPIRHHCEERRS